MTGGREEQYRAGNVPPHCTPPFMVCISRKKWESRRRDIEAAIHRIGNEHVDKFEKMWDDEHKAGRELLPGRGATISILSGREQARRIENGAKPAADEYPGHVKAKGLPGEEAVESIRDHLRAQRR